MECLLGLRRDVSVEPTRRSARRTGTPPAPHTSHPVSRLPAPPPLSCQLHPSMQDANHVHAVGPPEIAADPLDEEVEVAAAVTAFLTHVVAGPSATRASKPSRAPLSSPAMSAEPSVAVSVSSSSRSRRAEPSPLPRRARRRRLAEWSGSVLTRATPRGARGSIPTATASTARDSRASCPRMPDFSSMKCSVDPDGGTQLHPSPHRSASPATMHCCSESPSARGSGPFSCAQGRAPANDQNGARSRSDGRSTRSRARW